MILTTRLVKKGIFIIKLKWYEGHKPGDRYFC
jgi:hypothetical protein